MKDFDKETIPPFRWAEWMLCQTTSRALLVMGAILLVRDGIGVDVSSSFLETARALPHPLPEYTGMSVISPILARIVGIDSSVGLFLLHLILLLALAALVVMFIWKRFKERTARMFVLTAIAASGFPVVALGMVGSYDLWTFAAAVILVLGRRMWLAAIAGLLLGLTNFEQGAVALAAVALCAVALDRNFLKQVLAAALALLAARLGLQVWYASDGVDLETRAALLGPSFGQSLKGFARMWPIQLYSWFSAAWVVVLAALFNLDLRKRLVVLVGLVFIPAAATVATLDGTRVFVAVSLPSFMLLIARTAIISEPDPHGRKSLGFQSVVTMAIMMVTPGIITWYRGNIWVPWAPLFSRLGFHG